LSRVHAQFKIISLAIIAKHVNHHTIMWNTQTNDKTEQKANNGQASGAIPPRGDACRGREVCAGGETAVNCCSVWGISQVAFSTELMYPEICVSQTETAKQTTKHGKVGKS
jgi:hypothetical protein